MKKAVKKIVRLIFPESFRHFIWSIKPQIFKIYTMVLDDLKIIDNLMPIPENYLLQDVTWSDKDKLIKFFSFKGPTAFKRKVPKRLNSERCKGLAAIDKLSGDIVYNSWIIHDYKSYLKEFQVKTDDPIIFWESAECLPEHRHKGIHGRMEQEVINYCSRKGAKYLCIQIHASNTKGYKYNLSVGFKLISESYAISWPIFNIYRNLSSFLKNPFTRIFV